MPHVISHGENAESSHKEGPPQNHRMAMVKKTGNDGCHRDAEKSECSHAAEYGTV